MDQHIKHLQCPCCVDNYNLVLGIAANLLSILEQVACPGMPQALKVQ